MDDGFLSWLHGVASTRRVGAKVTFIKPPKRRELFTRVRYNLKRLIGRAAIAAKKYPKPAEDLTLIED